MKVAVVAHSGKTLGGGLPELRRALRAAGVRHPLWCEVPKAKQAPAQVRRALKAGVDVVFAWGGDGMVRRCINEMAGTKTRPAVLPAGTSNLFARSLDIPSDIAGAVGVGLHGVGREVDVGTFNGERFGVMAGAGFDAAMIRDSDALKERFGRAAYVIGGVRNLDAESFVATIDVDGVGWYEGPATCVLLGNIGKLFGGVEVFADARPDDGLLELGVVTAAGKVELLRTVARTVAGTADRSPFVRTTKARRVKSAWTARCATSSTAASAAPRRSSPSEIEPSEPGWVPRRPD